MPSEQVFIYIMARTVTIWWDGDVFFIWDQHSELDFIPSPTKLRTVGKQTHDLTVIASDSKTTQSGGDNHKKFPLGAALQVPQNFSFALL